MYILAGKDICTMNELIPLWNVVGTIMKTLWIGIPILLIIFGTIDLGKAVISSKEDEVKKAKQAFIRRLIYAVLVFAVAWLVGFIINLVSNMGINKVYDEKGNPIQTTDVSGWRACWDKIMK